MSEAPGYRCPACGEWVAPDNPARPFCCGRCKMLDLGHWLAGRYKIPADEESLQDEPLPGTEADLSSLTPPSDEAERRSSRRTPPPPQAADPHDAR